MNIAASDETMRMNPTAVYVGRQAIYNSRLKVAAYELLYRDSHHNRALFIDGEEATGQLLLNTFVDIGIEHIAGSRPAFINVSDEFVLNGHCESLPKERVVLELLEDAKPTAELADALMKLSQMGYRIALDDFVYEQHLDALIRCANIVKIDVQQLNPAQIEEHAKVLKGFGVELLAEKIETHDEYEFCKKLGFTYFQGYFTSRPRVIEGFRVPADRITTMRLVAKLHDPDVQISELEELIKRDPGLCYKLLLYINSSSCGLKNQIASIRQASTLVGLRKLRTWVSLLGFGAIKDKSPELVVTANVRAKMCELLATKSGHKDSDQYLTLGLFSLLDAFADCPMEQVLNLVPLADPITEALLESSGPLAWALQCVLDYEQANWEAVNSTGIDPQLISQAYLEAVDWTGQIMGELSQLDE